MAKSGQIDDLQATEPIPMQHFAAARQFSLAQLIKWPQAGLRLSALDRSLSIAGSLGQRHAHR